MGSKIQHLSTWLLVTMVTMGSLANQTPPDNLNCKYSQSEERLHCQNTNGSHVVPVPAYVDVLDLSDSGLQSIDPALLDSIQTTNTVILSNNNFTDIPQAITRITVLRGFDMSSNQLASVTTESMRFLTNVIDLDLSNNLITSVDKESFVQLRNLQDLRLSNNSLTVLPNGIFKSNSKLQKLTLEGNKISSISQATLQGLEHSLYYLDLESNNITQVSDSTFQHLEELRSLKLSGNEHLKSVNFIFPRHLSHLTASRCSITEIDECQFQHLIDLINLDLSDNNMNCDCHVIWLYDRYIHVKELNQPGGTQTKGPVENPWGCRITSLFEPLNCSDHEHIPIHCMLTEEHDLASDTATDFSMDVETTSDSLEISWAFNSSVDVYGFKIMLISEGSEVYRSPALHSEARQFSVEQNSGSVQACVQVYLNRTTILQEKCEDITIDDLKIVIGIVAGSVFLLPCIAGLLYIIYKDSINKRRQYTQLHEHDVTAVENTTIPVEKKPGKVKQSIASKSADIRGNVNPGFSSPSETDVKQSKTTVVTLETPVASNKTQTEPSQLRVDPSFISQSVEVTIESDPRPGIRLEESKVYSIKL